jgi:hypothetical protein
METPRRVVRLLAALALGPLLGACATPEPDVVATQVPARNDGGAFSFKELHMCREGRYEGNFASNSADGGFASTLRGPISFELVKQGSGEFFSVTHGEKLLGSSEQGDKFSADIVTEESGCSEGQFAVQLDGLYTPIGTTNEFPFTGTVKGKYLASDGDSDSVEEGFFLGKWQSFFLGDMIAEGSWSALWFGPNRAP